MVSSFFFGTNLAFHHYRLEMLFHRATASACFTGGVFPHVFGGLYGDTCFNSFDVDSSYNMIAGGHSFSLDIYSSTG